MENKKQEWYAQPAKYQTQLHTEEYTPNGKNTHHYTILEHEYVVLFNRKTGQYKVVKPDETNIAILDNECVRGTVKRINNDKE